MPKGKLGTLTRRPASQQHGEEDPMGGREPGGCLKRIRIGEGVVAAEGEITRG